MNNSSFCAVSAEPNAVAEEATIAEGSLTFYNWNDINVVSNVDWKKKFQTFIMVFKDFNRTRRNVPLIRNK